VSTIGVTSGRTPFGRSGNSISVMGRPVRYVSRIYPDNRFVLAHEGPVRNLVDDLGNHSRPTA